LVRTSLPAVKCKKPKFLEAVFDLGLTEAPKIVQYRVVAWKAPHAQKRLQSTVGAQLIGMRETLRSGNHA
jgi:hypothetical protein